MSTIHPFFAGFPVSNWKTYQQHNIFLFFTASKVPSRKKTRALHLAEKRLPVFVVPWLTFLKLDLVLLTVTHWRCQATYQNSHIKKIMQSQRFLRTPSSWDKVTAALNGLYQNCILCVDTSLDNSSSFCLSQHRGYNWRRFPTPR